MKRFFQSYLFLFVLAGLIVILDQISKAFVREMLPIGSFWSPFDWLTPYARIVHITNTGVAFGMFKGMNTVFIILAIIVSGVIIYYFPRVDRKDWIIRVALGMQLAGAVGNLIDRVIFGSVTDFISVGTFAVFNIADSSITVGVGVLLLGVWLDERRKKAVPLKEPDADPIPDESSSEPAEEEVKE